MTDAERVKLIDAAMRSHGTAGYLAGVERSFADAGRDSDASVTRALRALVEAGEIEVLMSMRAEWSGLRSLLQSPSSLGL